MSSNEPFIIFADHTASGPPDEEIEAIIQNKVLPLYNNTHSNSFTGIYMKQLIKMARQTLRHIFHLTDDDLIFFTGNGTTGAINHLVKILTPQITKKTVVFVSSAEHHSNYLPWTHTPATVRVIDLLETGHIDLASLQRKLKYYHQHGYQIFASFNAVSNVTGVFQPVLELSQLIHRYGGHIFFDLAAGAPYYQLPVNTPMYSIDGLFFSPHKFSGGHSTPGVLIMKKELYKKCKCPANCDGGGVVRFVDSKHVDYVSNPETRESAGTPNIIGIIRTALVVYKSHLKSDKILLREFAISDYVNQQLSKVKNIKLVQHKYQDRSRSLPIFSIKFNNLHYNLVVAILSDYYGIQSRGGISCCSLYAQQLLQLSKQQISKIRNNILSGHGVDKSYGWVRLTFHYSMPDYVIEYILDAINIIATHGPEFKLRYKYSPETNLWKIKSQYRSEIFDFSPYQVTSIDELFTKSIKKLNRHPSSSQLSSRSNEIAIRIQI